VLFFYRKNKEATQAATINPIDMIICLANVLCQNIYAIAHFTAVLTITAIIIVVVAVLRVISVRDATVSVIASTSVNHEKNATKYKLCAGR
jgi:hypothetical protein